MPALSKRLVCISELVKTGAAVCDVGTDHAYLAIELAKSGKAKYVIAVDKNEKPLHNAQRNLSLAGVKNIELRLCDGLSGVSRGEVDTVIIAGMGGEVISGILERGGFVAAEKGVTLILQPTTSPEFLRRFLYSNGYEILKEVPVCDNNKLYSVMLVKYTGESAEMPESFYYIGKTEPSSEAGLLYIKKQLARCKSCMDGMEGIPEKRAEFLQNRCAYFGIKKYLESFENGI